MVQQFLAQFSLYNFKSFLVYKVHSALCPFEVDRILLKSRKTHESLFIRILMTTFWPNCPTDKQKILLSRKHYSSHASSHQWSTNPMCTMYS